jgi:phosphonate transport system substrate-binding protein
MKPNRRKLLAAIAAIATSVTLLLTAPLPAQAQSRDPAKLHVVLLPDENASTLIQNAQPLKVYLEKVLKKEVELIVTTDYSSMIEAMRFGRIEVAYFGPFSYVLAKSRAPEIEPFAVGVERGSPSYNSILIATAGGPVKTLADVRGKPFGFGDQASTSSHLAPRAHLLKTAGLDGEKDYKPVHLGTHDAVARAVQAGQVPAGALSKAIYDTLVTRKTIDPAKIVQLDISDAIPNYPIVMQGNLAPTLKQAIRAAFLEMKDKEVLMAFRVDSFAATDDKAYDVLRDTAKVLKLDLAKMK